MSREESKNRASKSTPTIRFLCLGNSMQYFNDCPAVLENIIVASEVCAKVSHKECLRGGSDFHVLFTEGTSWTRRKLGMDFGLENLQELFAVSAEEKGENCDYAFVIMNDFTQTPARLTSREQSLEVLERNYLPLLESYDKDIGGDCKLYPILLETPAYGKPNYYGTSDLSPFDNFTRLVHEGYQRYQEFLETKLPSTRICPWGSAYAKIHSTNQSLFDNLYIFDIRHPSPQGTLLQAYLLYFMIMDTILQGDEVHSPPTYDPEWFANNGGINCVGTTTPTSEEAKELLDIAKVTFIESKGARSS